MLRLSGMRPALAVFGNFDPLEQESLTEDKKTDCMTTYYEDQDEYTYASITIVHYCTEAPGGALQLEIVVGVHYLE